MDFFKTIISDLYNGETTDEKKEIDVTSSVRGSEAETEQTKEKNPQEKKLQEKTPKEETMEKETSKPAYKNWLQSAISQSTEVWSHIKRDMTEAAQTVRAYEPLSAAERTATSMYNHISEAVHNLKESGEAAPVEHNQDADAEDETDVTMPGTDVKAVLTDMVSAIEKKFNNIFKMADEDEENKFTGDNREARIQVLRADPRTFEEEPPAATIEGVLCYADWRKAHFDENTCCPSGSGVVRGSTPTQVLEESPMVGRTITRLVNPDVTGSLTDADVWSRYFYHVYLLDLSEERRRKIFAECTPSLLTPATEVTETCDDEQKDTIKAWVLTPAMRITEKQDDDETSGLEIRQPKKEKTVLTEKDNHPPVEEASLDKLASALTSQTSSIVVLDVDEADLDEEMAERKLQTDHFESPPVVGDNEETESDGSFDAVKLSEDDLVAAQSEFKAAQLYAKTKETDDWGTWS